jgi:hypothetical protein
LTPNVTRNDPSDPLTIPRAAIHAYIWRALDAATGRQVKDYVAAARTEAGKLVRRIRPEKGVKKAS